MNLPQFQTRRLAARGLNHGGELNSYENTAEAHVEELAFREARAKVPQEARFGNNLCQDLLGVAERLLAGEILVRREDSRDQGLAFLRDAVRREDQLAYDEPPDWIHPARHVLGAVLIAQDNSHEAETVYREDLRRLPENGWSLFGLSRALAQLGEDREAAEVRARFEAVWSQADLELYSSCVCQTQIPNPDFQNHEPFSHGILEAKQIVLYAGLPRPDEYAEGEEIARQEIDPQDTLTLRGFGFFAEPVQLKVADAETLTMILADAASFEPYRGPKFCGGFHPDFLAEWKIDGQTYRSFICFGCHEMQAFGPKFSLNCDIKEKAYDKLVALLTPYTPPRSSPDKELESAK